MNKRDLATMSREVRESIAHLPRTYWSLPCERCQNITPLLVGTQTCQACVAGALLADRVHALRLLERVTRVAAVPGRAA